MESHIAYSRIVVYLVPRLAPTSEEKTTIPFSWIARLDPLYPSLARLDGAIEFQLSEDFALFDKEKIFRAESAEGTRVRVATINNNPQGDSDFWQKALNFHLGRYYKEAELKTGSLFTI